VSLLDAAAQPHTCAVQSPVYGSADAGGGTSVSSWTTVSAAAPCQVDAGGGSLRDQFGGDVLADQITVYFVSDLGIANGYRIEYPVGSSKYWRFTGGQGLQPAAGGIPAQYSYTFERITS